MTADPLANLTQAQRECLRLVLTRQNSKEIAKALGISPHSVDKRLERAVATMGATSRFDAARRLAAFENRATYEPFAHEPIDLAEPFVTEPLDRLAGPRGYGRRLFGLLPLRQDWGDVRNDLGRVWRLTLIFALILGIAIATMALLNIAATLRDTIEHRTDRPH